MDVSSVLTVVQTLIKVINSPEFGSIWSLNNSIAELNETMGDIHAWLQDAAEIEALQLGDMSHTFRRQIKSLQDVMYQVEDLLDEVNYVVQLKKAMSRNRPTQEVQLFFSRFNQLHFSVTMNKKMKNIRERLDGILKNAYISQCLNTSNVTSKIEKRDSLRERVRQSRTSTVHQTNIIGREGDKKKVIKHLLSGANDDVQQQHPHFVTIVGLGGMGKTTLAKLICNDDKIKNKFAKQLDVCVDKTFHLNLILQELLIQLGVEKNKLETRNIEQEFRKKIKGIKYLLLLDDVWSEDQNHWRKLKELLGEGENGSKVVVTTRSMKVATMVGGKTHELKGLDEKDSRSLFTLIALGGEENVEANKEFHDIGEEIVKKCGNLPLTIRVVAALLWNQPISKWKAIKNKTNVTNVTNGDSCGVMAILKLSYYDLDPQIRRCFSLCAMFPKDYVINKKTLIHLWMAHGWIQEEEGQSVEDVGEDCFMELQQRFFIQECHGEEGGSIDGWKIHDLMHDVACDVAGAEMFAMSSTVAQVPNKCARHVCYYGREGDISFVDRYRNVRTFFMSSNDFLWCENMKNISKFKYLRALRIYSRAFIRLPNLVAKLIHLRFLDISGSTNLKVLPESLVDLVKLQVLLLGGCTELKYLPRGLSKLVNLRHLDITSCHKLKQMPPRMKNMKNLQQLSTFVVNERDGGCNWMQSQSSRLGDLEALKSLKGSLEIRVVHGKLGGKETPFVLKDNLPLINELRIEWDSEDETEEDWLVLLERLHPHEKTKVFAIVNYPGKKFEGWASMENFENRLRNLVKLKIDSCVGLERLSSFSQLHMLKELDIRDLENLEYMEMSRNNDDGNGSETCSTLSIAANNAGVDDLILFPVLEKLTLRELPKLKGWMRSTSTSTSTSRRMGQFMGDQQEEEILLFSKFSFPCLSELGVLKCPKLEFNIIAPKLEDVYVFESPGLRWGSNSSCSSSSDIGKIQTDNLSLVKHLPVGVVNLEIVFNVESNGPTVFSSTSSNLCLSLRTLIIWTSEIVSLCGVGLENLTNLETLGLHGCRELSEIGDENGMPWKSLHSNLRHLTLACLDNIRSICGVGLENLTNLETLNLEGCGELSEIGDENGMPWKSLHSNLRQLELAGLDNIRSICGVGLENLTNLEILNLGWWELSEIGDENGMPWKSLHSNLHQLTFDYLPKMTQLPNGIQYLTSLQSLALFQCEKLEGVPNWMTSLTSLHSLTILGNCGLLSQRCKKPDGEDFHKIKHIPNLYM